MKRCGFRESLINLRVLLQDKLEEGIGIETIQQINYIIEGHYQICQDPLRNIAIGLPALKATKSQRKRTLRVALFHFAARHSQGHISNVTEDIPVREAEVIRIEAFFPPTVKEKQKVTASDRLKESLKTRQSDIEIKEKELNQRLLSNSTTYNKQGL